LSAYVYLTPPDATSGYLFADGATYTDDGIVRGFCTKIECGKIAPVAITAVGHQVLGDQIKTFLVKQADLYGIDAFVDEFLPAFLPKVAMTFIENQQHAVQNIAVTIAAWSASKGAFRISFQTMDRGEMKAFEPVITRENTWRGPQFSPLRLAELRNLLPCEPISEYMRYVGKTFMGFMREISSLPLHLEGSGANLRHVVGGHVDLAVVDKNGARIERVLVWDDKLGQLIDPSVDHKTVVRLMNRKARRALRGAA